MEHQINLPNEGLANLIYNGIVRNNLESRNPEELIERNERTIRFSSEVYEEIVRLLATARISFNPYNPNNPDGPTNPIGRAA